MSASQGSALTSIGFQLRAALEAYESDIQSIATNPPDPELYQAASRRIDELRMYAATFPGLSVAWVELLIRHFELMHGLWRLQQGRLTRAELEDFHVQLQAAVQRLRRQCTARMIEPEVQD